MAAAAAPLASRQIESARQLIHEIRYAEAGRLVDETLLRGGLDRSSLIELWALQGIVQASLGSRDRAQAAFARLLELDPLYALPSDLAPKVKAPFSEAIKARTGVGPLAFSVTPVDRRLMAKVSSDPLGLGRTVRFSVRVGGGGWDVREAPASDASLALPKGRVEWFAQLLDSAADVLAEVGSKSEPQVVEPPPPAPQVALPSVVEQPAAASSGPRLLPLGIGLAVVAAAAAGTGIGFGVSSSSARQQLNAAIGGAMGGVVSSISMDEAQALNDRVATHASVANGLYIAAGVALVAAIAVLVFGS